MKTLTGVIILCVLALGAHEQVCAIELQGKCAAVVTEVQGACSLSDENGIKKVVNVGMLLSAGQRLELEKSSQVKIKYCANGVEIAIVTPWFVIPNPAALSTSNVKQRSSRGGRLMGPSPKPESSQSLPAQHGQRESQPE